MGGRDNGHRHDTLIYEELSAHIIGAAMTVLNELKPGLDEKLYDNHVAQMIGYLAKTEIRLALLLNFKYAKLQWKRMVR